MSDINATDVYARIRTLEGQVAALAQHMGVELPDAEALAAASAGQLPQDVVDLARSGNTIGAIKRYRELTGCDLHEAKDVVDAIT